MTLNQLKCFAAVAEYSNFTMAAMHLNIVQSGISYNISELEKELNVKLFIRDSKNVTLTYAGTQLLEKVYSINALTRDIEIIAKKVSGGVNGKLRIGYPFVPIIYRYKELFADFQQKYPNVDIKYDSYSAFKLSRELDNKNIDIAFTRHEFVQNFKNLIWKPLYSDTLCVVVGSKHPLHQLSSAHVKDFEKDTLIISSRYYDPGWYDLAMDVCFHEKIAPEINDRCTDVYSVIFSVELGTGFTILPKCWKETLNQNLFFIEIEEASKAITGIAINTNADNQCVDLFLEEITSCFL